MCNKLLLLKQQRQWLKFLNRIERDLVYKQDIRNIISAVISQVLGRYLESVLIVYPGEKCLTEDDILVIVEQIIYRIDHEFLRDKCISLGFDVYIHIIRLAKRILIEKKALEIQKAYQAV